MLLSQCLKDILLVCISSPRNPMLLRFHHVLHKEIVWNSTSTHAKKLRLRRSADCDLLLLLLSSVTKSTAGDMSSC